jgi:hypothetical protein
MIPRSRTFFADSWSIAARAIVGLVRQSYVERTASGLLILSLLLPGILLLVPPREVNASTQLRKGVPLSSPPELYLVPATTHTNELIRFVASAVPIQPDAFHLVPAWASRPAMRTRLTSSRSQFMLCIGTV